MAKDTVICTYRTRAGEDAAFVELLARHWPTLRDLGVVTDEPALVFRSVGQGPPTFVEIFTWLEDGFGRAREHPDVLAIWEPMEQLCEARGGLPAVEFPHFERVVT
jgi:hypothetical protein